MSGYEGLYTAGYSLLATYQIENCLNFSIYVTAFLGLAESLEQPRRVELHRAHLLRGVLL